MVITRIAGGLGNQLFQYYAGWSIARRLNRRLYADVSSYQFPQQLPYRLGALGLGQGINIEKEEVKAAIFKAFSQHYSSTVKSDPHKELYKVIMEKTDVSESEDLFREAACSCVCLMDGAWHSYKYLQDLLPAEYCKLQLSCPACEYWFSELIPPGEARSTVAIHIHHADTGIDSVLYHSATLEFYQRAIAFVSARLDRPRFVLFADNWEDPLAGEIEGFLNGRLSIARGTGMEELDVFRVMAKFSNHIIGTSTLGWWAAYLASQLRTDHGWTVVPERWHIQENPRSLDLIPPGWVRIPY